jgi:transcriptional regulator with XRE-family HTH domain
MIDTAETHDLHVASSAVESLPHLREWREHLSYGQRELARLADVSIGTLRNLELLGRPAQPRTVRALAKSLGITVQQLRQAPPQSDDAR